jgi:hypothetical protein
MPEIGLPGQQVSILQGDDIDPATGRLLSVAELQDALEAAVRVRAARLAARSTPRQTLPAEPTIDPPDGDHPLADHPLAAAGGGAARTRRWLGRLRIAGSPAEHRDPSEPAGAAAPSRLAPAGFTGAAAERAWAWITGAAPPRMLVCAAPGVGLEGTRITALVAGVLGAARRTLAVEIARGASSSLTRLVCGSSAEAVSAVDWLPADVTAMARLEALPAGPSGTRVVQTGTHFFDRLLERAPAETALVTELGCLEHADVRGVLRTHPGPTVMVARADQAGVTAALAALTDLDAEGVPHRPLLVLADTDGARPAALRTAQRLAATGADRVVVVPRSRELRACPIPVGGWRRDLSAAVAELLDGLAQQAARRGDTSARA